MSDNNTPRKGSGRKAGSFSFGYVAAGDLVAKFGLVGQVPVSVKWAEKHGLKLVPVSLPDVLKNNGANSSAVPASQTPTAGGSTSGS